VERFRDFQVPPLLEGKEIGGISSETFGKSAGVARLGSDPLGPAAAPIPRTSVSGKRGPMNVSEKKGPMKGRDP
jgi:hypothetical protein